MAGNIGTTFKNFGPFLQCNSMCSPHRGFYRQRLFADLLEVLIWETQIPVVVYICSLFSHLFVHIYFYLGFLHLTF